VKTTKSVNTGKNVLTVNTVMTDKVGTKVIKKIEKNEEVKTVKVVKKTK